MSARSHLLLAAGALLAATVQGANSEALRQITPTSAECAAAAYNANPPAFTTYIWSDKYVYQRGERLTLRWTIKDLGDTAPYTVVAYRQNNQNGKKFYLPAGTEEATDIFGNTPDKFQAVTLATVEKQVLLGEGGAIGAAAAIPDEPGMHTLVLQFRDCSGTRILKSAYMKIGVVTETEDITGNIESNRTLVNTKAYRLRGVVYVRNNAVLTIEPGTFVFGQPGSQPPSVLVVTRNGRIVAEGTRSRPIVMTSSQPFGERQRGDWGGLMMLGRAPINVGANVGGQSNAGGEFNVEGLPAAEDSRYGGTDSNHNCGTLRYVRVEYAGSIFAPNNESNSFTWAGCGKATVADHLQAIYGLDDSFEWFGGNADAKYLVGGLGADDYIDFQLGYTGRVQYGLFYQSSDARGNRGIEGDNSEYNQSATPLSKPQMFNLTFIGSGEPGFDEANSPGVYLRRGSGGDFNNLVVSTFYSTAVMVDGDPAKAQLDNGNLKMNGLLIHKNAIGSNGAATAAGQIETSTIPFAEGRRGEAKNFVYLDPKFRRITEWSDPDFRGAFSSPIFRANWVQPPDDGFFDQAARFVGGVGDEAWWEEWTSFLQDSDIKK